MSLISFYSSERENAYFGDALENAKNRVLTGGVCCSSQEECELFEAAFAAFCGTQFCIGVKGGSEALMLVLKGYLALGKLREHDGVILPSNSPSELLQTIVGANLVPVPAEPSRASFLIDAFSVENAFEKCGTLHVGAIVARHLYGRVCDMGSLRTFAKYHNMLLLEDASEAVGAYLNDSRIADDDRKRGCSGYAGALSDAAAFDLGAITTSDAELVNTIRNVLTVQNKMPEVDAALWNIKLPHVLKLAEKRREIAKTYLSQIQNDLVRLPNMGRADQNGLDNVWNIFAVHTGERDALQSHMLECGVETKIYGGSPQFFNEYPLAKRLANSELSLPMHAFLTNEEIETVIRAVNTFVAG